MFETLFGGLLGGLFRLAPEVLKWFDRKNERDHEYRMLHAEIEVAKYKADAQMKTVEAGIDMAQMQAIGEALKGQASMAEAGGKIVAAISALIRPAVTVWFVALYSAVKVAVMLMAYEVSASWKDVLINTWNKDDMAILMMILTFWFVGRAIEKTQQR